MNGEWVRNNIIYHFGSNLRMKKKHENSSVAAAPVQRHIIFNCAFRFLAYAT